MVNQIAGILLVVALGMCVVAFPLSYGCSLVTDHGSGPCATSLARVRTAPQIFPAGAKNKKSPAEVPRGWSEATSLERGHQNHLSSIRSPPIVS